MSYRWPSVVMSPSSLALPGALQNGQRSCRSHQLVFLLHWTSHPGTGSETTEARRDIRRARGRAVGFEGLSARLRHGAHASSGRRSSRRYLRCSMCERRSARPARSTALRYCASNHANRKDTAPASTSSPPAMSVGILSFGRCGSSCEAVIRESVLDRTAALASLAATSLT